MRHGSLLALSLVLSLAPAAAQSEEERELVAFAIRVVAAIDDGDEDALEELAAEGLDVDQVVDSFEDTLLFDTFPDDYRRPGAREAEIVRRFRVDEDRTSITLNLMASGGVHHLHVSLVRREGAYRVSRVYQTGW